MHFSMVEVYMVGAAALWSGSRGQSVRTADEDCKSDADSVRKENEQCVRRTSNGVSALGGQMAAIHMDMLMHPFLTDIHNLLSRR